jgi:hypothetical protein
VVALHSLLSLPLTAHHFMLFVYVIDNFACADYNYESSPLSCNNPYKQDLSFTSLDYKLINKVIELDQLGIMNNNTAFIHANQLQAGSQQLQQLINSLLTTVSTGEIKLELSTLDILPPSSANVFLSFNSSINSLVISGYDKQFINPFYHSHFDRTLNSNNLCANAKLIASGILKDAGLSSSVISELIIDCDYIRTLSACLISNMQCDYFHSLLNEGDQSAASAASAPVQPSHYPSVFQLMSTDYYPRTSKIYYNLLSTALANLSTSIHYHDSYDPALSFDYEEQQWRIDTQANDTLIWTESNWDNDIGTTVYRREDPKIERIMLGLGVAMFVLSFLLVFAAKKKCQTHYKAI